MPLKLNSSGGGSVTLDTPSTASTFTLTVPAITGTAVVTGSSATVSQGMLAAGVAGNGPAFSAYRTADQSVSSATWTKVALNLESFDTANCFDSTTNYRFTPNVAGYYQFNGRIFGGGASQTSAYVSFYKNGALLSQSGAGVGGAGVSIGIVPQVSDVIYMNGTTDYIELYGFISATSPQFTGATGQFSVFSGSLVRSA